MLSPAVPVDTSQRETFLTYQCHDVGITGKPGGVKEPSPRVSKLSSIRLVLRWEPMGLAVPMTNGINMNEYYMDRRKVLTIHVTHSIIAGCTEMRVRHRVRPALMRSAGVDRSPALILIQASSRSWSGDPDYSMRDVEGEPAVVHTLRAARRCFPEVPIRIVAPAFDRDGRLSEIALSADGDVRALYGFDCSPLDRMLVAAESLPESAYVMRVDGLHFPADFQLAASMLAYAGERELDGIKTPDDFPPQLSVDVFRVGALRRARTLIADKQSPLLVHPKFLLATHPGLFRFERYEDLPSYSDEYLRSIRAKTAAGLSDAERTDVGGQRRFRQGDQLGYHYELALRYVRPASQVLDVACGTGFGTRLLAQHCAAVVGLDRDEESIARARATANGCASEYVVADATQMPFAEAVFDTVVSFETLEHVPPQRFLEEIERVLAPGGLLLLSTPQNRLGHIPFMPCHLHEFSLEELTEIVSAHFEIHERIGLKAGTIWFEGDPVGSNSFFVCSRR